MKTAFVPTAFAAVAALALAAAPAGAVTPKVPATAGLYTCTGHALSRVALQAQPQQPAPCCTGMLGCPQLLANTGLIRPKRDNRT